MSAHDTALILAAVIGVVIALGLASSLVIVVVGLVYHNRTLADPGAEIVAAAVTAMATYLGAMATFLGVYLGRREKAPGQ